MKFSPSDFITYFRPSKCGLRIYLKHHEEPEDMLSPYEEVLLKLAERHEKTHLESLTPIIDLSNVPTANRSAATLQTIKSEAPAIYQAMFHGTIRLANVDCEIVGIPDFLIWQGNDYIIRDSKISRRITETDHPEILQQLQLYGWLFEQSLGRAPGALEVHSETGEIIKLQYDGGSSALSTLEEILNLKATASEPYSPVGWTKCASCCFASRCLQRAEEKLDVALVYGVDQGLAQALHDNGIGTIDALIEKFDASRLSVYQRPYGNRRQRVGKSATSILRMANAMASGKEIMFNMPELPNSSNYAMFDLEGLPPHLDELGKIYLWGVQVFGETPTDYMAATAHFGSGGDQKGWKDFLSTAQSIFDIYGDIPFVHWHHYERVHIDAYVKRYGDLNGIADRVLRNLLDLLPITQKSIALPLPSYSLKVIEKYVGFKRKQKEYGGEWSMAQYIEAIEANDQSQRAHIIDKILLYNREDLEATWAVFLWLQDKCNAAR
jgi:predicted RecB family nuclease